jgi:hypothetical protein
LGCLICFGIAKSTSAACSQCNALREERDQELIENTLWRKRYSFREN